MAGAGLRRGGAVRCGCGSVSMLSQIGLRTGEVRSLRSRLGFDGSAMSIELCALARRRT